MDKSSRIFVAGHAGLAGSAICRRLREDGYQQLVTRSRSDLDLRDQSAVDRFFAEERPGYGAMAELAGRLVGREAAPCR